MKCFEDITVCNYLFLYDFNVCIILNLNISQITSHLSEDYHYLAVMKIFLEQSINDEEVKEAGRLKQDFINFRDALKTAMCNIALYLASSELAFPNSSIIPDHLRNGTSVENYIRDLKLMKHSRTILNTMMLKYNAILEIRKVFGKFSNNFDNSNRC